MQLINSKCERLYKNRGFCKFPGQQQVCVKDDVPTNSPKSLKIDVNEQMPTILNDPKQRCEEEWPKIRSQ